MSLNLLWQDDFVQDDERTLFMNNLPVAGNPNATNSLMSGPNVFHNVGELKKAIEKAAKNAAPVDAKVTVDPATLKPKPPFSAFVMFATPDDANAILSKGKLKLKGIECLVKPVVRPHAQQHANRAPPPPASASAYAAPPAADNDPNTDDDTFVQCNRTVCLRHLPVEKRNSSRLQVTSAKKLRALLSGSPHFAVEGVRLLRDPAGKGFTGTGFVTLATLPQAKMLLQERKVLLSHGYQVEVCEPKPAPPPPSTTTTTTTTAPPSTATPPPPPPPQQPVTVPAVTTAAAAAGRFAPPPPAAAGSNPRGDFIVDFDEGARRYSAQARVGSPLHTRPMVPVPQPHTPRHDDSGVSFTAMTWNVLFRKFASHHEQYCDRYDLALPIRRGMVHACVTRHRPDILALQELEVDGNDATYIRQELEGAGYEVESMAKGDGGPDMDGCAIAYRRDVFAARPVDVRSDRISARFVMVGVFARLRHRASGRYVVVATTHLKAGPEFERDRQSQMEVLLDGVRTSFMHPRGAGGDGCAAADKIKDQVLPALGSAAADVPVIVLGDFNTEPRWELIPSLEAASPVGPLRDAYANNCTATTATSGHHPPGYTDTPFTSYSWFLQGVADYVLHTDGLVAVKVLKVPGTREVRALYAADYPPQRGGGPRFEMLPTRSFPSDHVPLMVEFAFAAAPADIGVHTPPAGPAAASLPPPPPPVVWSCGARSPAMTTSSQPTATHETTTHAAASSVVQDHHHHDQPRSVAVGGASGRVPTMHDDDDASPPPPPPAVGAFPAAAKAQTAASVATSSPPPGDRETREQSHHHHDDEDAVRSIATAEVAPLCSHRTTTASEAPTPPALPASTLDEQGVSSRGPAHGGGDGAATVRNASANAVAPDDDDADHDGVVVRGDCGPHDDNARAGHHHHHHDATRDVEPCAAADSDDDGAAHAADAANDGADSASASSSSDCEIVGEL